MLVKSTVSLTPSPLFLLGCIVLSSISVNGFQSALEVEEMSTVSPDVRKRKYGNKYACPVKLMNALEVCLFGVGLPAEQGLLDVLVHDLGPDYIEKSSMVMGAAVDTAPVAEKPTARTPTRRASAFLQCLVAEGIRVRDLLMLLLHLRHTYCLSSSSVSREFAVRWPGADAQAPAVVAQIPRDARRLAMAEVVRSLVEWLANTAWAWTFVGSSGASEGWVDDLAAAATAVTTSVPFAAGAPGATAVGSSQLGVQLDGGWRYGGDGKHLEADGPIDLVDRLVAAAAAAVSQAAPNVNWVDILSRVVAIARTDSVSAYAATCVERSVALGGQAPFPVIGGQRLAQAEGQDLCRLLEQSCALREESGTGGTARVVLVRTAAAAIAACREARCVFGEAISLAGIFPGGEGGVYS